MPIKNDQDIKQLVESLISFEKSTIELTDKLVIVIYNMGYMFGVLTTCINSINPRTY